MQSLALGLFVLKISTPTSVGIAAALQFLPMLVLGSWAGLVVDRSRKRPMLYLTQSVACVLALSLGVLVATGAATLSWIYLICLGTGFVNLFDNPARQTFVGEMVGNDLLPNAVSLNTVLMNASRVVGPAVAAVLLALHVSLEGCFFANALSYLAVLAALGAMRAAELRPARQVRHAKGQVREGFGYVKARSQLYAPLLAMFVVGTLAFNFTVTLPALAKRTFSTTNIGYSHFMMAMGLGAVFGGLAAAFHGRPNQQRLAMLGLGFGVTMTALAFAPTTTWAVIVLVPMGFFSIAFVATANGTLQLNAAPEMRGRVMALYAIAFLGTTPIGGPLVGWIATVTNARVSILVGGLATVAAGGLLAAHGRIQARAAAPGRTEPVAT